MNFWDYTEAFFWTLTYIVIAFTGFINKDDKRICIPIVTLWINFSWETASIIYSVNQGFDIFDQGHFIRFSWFFFDLFILYIFFKKSDFSKKIPCLVLYFSLFFILTPTFFYSFNNIEFGMPITAFIIDALMEIFFWFGRKKLDPSNRLQVGICKILGDLFAGIFFGPVHTVVVILACTAFFFDVLYIIFAIKEKQLQPNLNDNFKQNYNEFIKKFKVQLSGTKTYQKKRTYKKKSKSKKTHRKK